MRIDFFTLFPEWFEWFQTQRHVRNALAGGSELRCFNFRETTPLGAGQVDDSPYGGGAGMLMRIDVVDAALESAYAQAGARPRILVMDPSGRQLDDQLVTELAEEPSLALLCGRYEGIDDRVRAHIADDAVSIGRYVLAGGELPAMVIADAVLRKLPGALGHSHSVVEESYSPALEGRPEYPHYTRPPNYRGWGVPEVLLSGDHGAVESWRREQSRIKAGEGTSE